MSTKRALILFALALILQPGLLNLLAIGGVTPNLILCLGLFIGFSEPEGIRPALLGVPFVLVLDLLGGSYAGVGALCYFLVILLLAFVVRDLNRDHWLPLLAVSLGGILLYYLAHWAILALLGNPSGLVRVLWFLAGAVPANLAVLLLLELLRRLRRRPWQRREAGLLRPTRKSKQNQFSRYRT